MDPDRNPVVLGYQAGGIFGLLLGGFVADTWLGFAVCVGASALGGILLGWVASKVKGLWSES